MRTCAEEGDEDALKILRESFNAALKAAESGEAAALCDLGEHYSYGFGTAANEAEAVNCYLKAATGGCAKAMRSLGWCYFDGRCIAADKEKSQAWYKKAAFAFYDEDNIDEALFCLHGLPEDGDIHTLKRSMRYDDEAKGIVVVKGGGTL
jgi:TPR repeat protein